MGEVGGVLSDEERRHLKEVFERLRKEIAREAFYLGAMIFKPKIVAVPMKSIGTAAAISNDSTTIYIAKEALARATGQKEKAAMKALLLHEILHAVMLDSLRLSRITSKYRADLPRKVKHTAANVVADAYNNEILAAILGEEAIGALKSLISDLLNLSERETIVNFANLGDVLEKWGIEKEIAEEAPRRSKEQLLREILLRMPKMKEGQGDGEGDGDGGGAGIMNDLLNDKNESEEITLQEGDEKWQKEVKNATQSNDAEDEIKKISEEATSRALMAAKLAGRCPAALERLFKVQAENSIPWRRIVRATVKEAFGDLREPSWHRANRRQIKEFPGHRWCGKRPTVIIAIDASGSISNDELNRFVSEVYAVSKLRCKEIIVFSWDAEAYDPVKISNPAQVAIKLQNALKGGGGTQVTAAAQKIKEIVERGARRNVIAVVITDGFWAESDEEAESAFREILPKVDRLLIFTTGKVPEIDLPKVEIRKISFVS